MKISGLVAGKMWVSYTWSATIGAGPEAGKLVSNLNRPSDLNLSNNVSSSPLFSQSCPTPTTEDKAIEQLLNADSNYKDLLNYAIFPQPYTNGYNSNSYISGLLRASGHKTIAPSNTPGYGKPVPSSEF